MSVRISFVILSAAVLSAGCASGGGLRDIVSAQKREDTVVPVRSDNNAKAHGNGKARGLTGVPKGHYPPPGECRLWFEGRPPGKQPAPTKCSSLAGRVPAGAFVLYNGKAYDMDYDWRRDKQAPAIIVNLKAAPKKSK